MATAIYVSAMIQDVKLLLDNCNVIMNMKEEQPSTQNARLKYALDTAVSLHVKIIK